MFGIELEAARRQWIENYDEEDGSSAESLRVALFSFPEIISLPIVDGSWLS
jgi:hypothetical protein